MAKRKKRVSAYARKVGAAMKRGMSMKAAHRAAKSGRSGPKKRRASPKRRKSPRRNVRAKTKAYKPKRSNGSMTNGFKKYSAGLAAGDAVNLAYHRATKPVPIARHPIITIPLRATASYFGSGGKAAGAAAAVTQLVTGAIEVFVQNGNSGGQTNVGGSAPW